MVLDVRVSEQEARKTSLVNVIPKDFNDKKLFEVEFVYCMLILG